MGTPTSAGGPAAGVTWAGRPASDAHLGAVLTEMGPELRRLASAYARDGADRDDLLQEISIALWKALPRFRGEASLSTFALRVARNRCVTHLVRRRRRDTREVPLACEQPWASADQPWGGVVDPVERRDRFDRLRAAVALLPAPLRATLLLRLDGLSDREIGDRLGITPNATAVRLFRARRSLRDLLDPRDFVV